MEQPMKFSMPMMNDFVPERLRPWLYVFIALCFQISGARYLGPLNEIIGADSNMREDVLMCMYCNLGGMAIWFPMLFRMKFRFTNKTLLTASSIVVIITNYLTAYVTFLPLLWAICFIEGIAKIQGTFECMSNIQLWMTPRRDFRVFFPILHIIILSSICIQDLLSSWFGYIGDWRLMHSLVIGLQLIVLLILTTCVHHFRFMKLPLYGIDWTGMVLWIALLLQLAYLLDYGDWYSWYNHSQTWYITGFALLTFGIILFRMKTVRHPYISPRVFTGFANVKSILVLVVIAEAILGTEYVLEEIFLESGLHYNSLVNSYLVWPVWIGNISGCLFSLAWLLKIKSYPYIRLGIVGTISLSAYIILMYLLVSPQLNIEKLYLPLLFRGFAYACLSIMFMISLHDSMDFHHFFQGLSVFNMLHMIIGGCVGCALYAHGISHYVASLLSRYGVYVDQVRWGILRIRETPGQFMGEFIDSILCMSVKSVYGWVAYACLTLLACFLMFDSPIRRQHPHLMQPWSKVGRRLKKHLY